MGSPVRGLRPTRAGRFFTSKLPKPTICTLSPLFMAVSTAPVKAARAASQSFLLRPLVSAMAAVSSVLFMEMNLLFVYSMTAL